MSEYYLTHFIPDDIPDSGYIKLAVYTTNDISKKHGIFYYGYGNREIELAEIDHKVKEGWIKELPQFEEVQRGDVLWLDSEGALYIANAKDPLKDDINGYKKFSGKKLSVSIYQFQQPKNKILPF